MKTIALRFRKSYREDNCVFGDAYQAKCPHCGHLNMVWPSELEKGVPDDTGNVCLHVDRVLSTKKLAIRAKMDVRAFGSVVKVNGITVPVSLYDLLYRELESLQEEADRGEWMRWPKWCPRRRFEAVKKEVDRVYHANPERWKAQHEARHEEVERAELARLKAKYEKVTEKI